MTERQLKKSVVFAVHVFAACFLWKHFRPDTDYNSLPILAAVILGGSLSYFFLEYLKEPPSHKEVELWQGKPSYFFREYAQEDAMQPMRPWPKPAPQPPPKTDWELYLDDIYSEMSLDDLYEKWRDRVPRRPKEKTNAHHQGT